MKAITTKIIITSIRAKADGSLGFSAETPEYSIEDKIVFMGLQNQNVTALFQPSDEEVEETVTVDKDVENKTQSQRLRAVLFLLWKSRGSEGEFRTFYHEQLERIINKVKSLLE